MARCAEGRGQWQPTGEVNPWPRLGRLRPYTEPLLVRALESAAATDEMIILAMLNDLDALALPAIRDWTQGDRTLVQVPWPPADLERTTPSGAIGPSFCVPAGRASGAVASGLGPGPLTGQADL